LKGDEEGENGDPAVFKGRIVVKNGSVIRYFQMEMSDLINGSFTYSADAEDEEISLVIISVPNSFRGNQKFRYQLKIDYNNLSGVGAVETKSSLGKNYPNPFDSETHIPYELTQGSEVEFTITDGLGRQVIRMDEGYKTAGKHDFTISAQQFKSGLYYYKLTTDDFSQTQTMLVK